MKQHPEQLLIAICLATYKRPDLLSQLLESLDRIAPILGASVELRIVDNDSTGSARESVDLFRSKTCVFESVHYIVEPRQNIAHARNAGLDFGPADIIIFIDDDEVVSQNWLADLFKVCIENKADAVFGPVIGRCPAGSPKWMTAGNFFNKLVPESGTRIGWKETRTSNTLVRGEWFYGEKALRFNPELGRSGGSDSELFSRMENQGGIFVSCQEAVVEEAVPPSRASFRWLWNRWYRNGLIYERIATTKDNEPSSLVRLLRRVGATVLMLASGLPKAISGNPSRCIQGLLKFSLGCGGLVAWIQPRKTADHVAYSSTPDDSKKENLMRVAFLTNIISPYRKPVFQRLTETPGWDFKVFTDAEKEFDRDWENDNSGLTIKKTACLSWKRTVTSHHPVHFKQVITLHFPIGLIKDLFTFRPQAVISLELGFRTAFAAAYCTLTGTPLTIWAYQSRISSTQGSSRLLWRRWLLKRATRVVGMGLQAREVLIQWGVDPEKIIDAPNAADHVTLSARLAQHDTAHSINQIREQKAKNKKMAVVVGRLIPLKGIEHILSAWKSMSPSVREEWQLVFIGNGPLEELIKKEQDASISLAGLVKPESMALWYAAADLHIFPSCGDVWGLVVNEASTCGTPSLCSVHAGCYDDLIIDGENGFAIDFTDTEKAVPVLEKALTSPNLAEIGIAAHQHISTFTLDKMADRFRRSTQSFKNSSTRAFKSSCNVSI
jgi:glycosyltransferase involved in cell wall biosynthesis